MHYFESSITQNDTAEIINLKRILELCHIPNVGSSPLDPNLSSDSRCTNALTTLEKTTSVFDDAFYEDAVFIEEMDEDIVEAELWETAKAKGVPEDHFPAKCMRTTPPCPATPSLDSVLAISKDPKVNSNNQQPLLQIQSEKERKLSSNDTVSPKQTPRSLSLSLSFRKSNRSSSSTYSRPDSPSSFFSNFSRSSSMSAQAQRGKTRDSLMNLFRREYKSSQRPAPLDETQAWSPPPTDSDAPSLQSVRTNSQISSSPSISVSSRTSTSSFADLSLFSWSDGRALQKCAKSPRFIPLRIRCLNEAKRFIDFAQHQRVALPLFLGRTRMYLDGRNKTRIEQLAKEHEIAMEELENKHLEQELFEMNEQAEHTKEKATKNATALKHMNKRLSILGDNATPEEHKRLEEEMQALEKFAQRQQRDMRNLLREQNKEKHLLKKEKQREMEAFETSLKEDYELKIRHKEEELVKNMTKLEELIHARRMRLVARWHLTLQIFKREDRDASAIKGPLPLTLLCLPEEFAPYVAAYQS